MVVKAATKVFPVLSFSGSYGGLSKFKPKGYTKKEITEWLQTQDPYTLHKPISRRFPRCRVPVYGIDHQWQAALVDVSRISSYNKTSVFKKWTQFWTSFLLRLGVFGEYGLIGVGLCCRLRDLARPSVPPSSPPPLQTPENEDILEIEIMESGPKMHRAKTVVVCEISVFFWSD
jgi:hypothetical protein